MVDIQIGMLSIQLHRKDIKNLHLGVYPPAGRVRAWSVRSQAFPTE